jgi:hypothetical protein
LVGNSGTAVIDPDLPSQDTYLVKHKISEPKQALEAEKRVRRETGKE